MLKNFGYCPCCMQPTTFYSYDDWYRDHYICEKCTCIPRERALMVCLDTFVPNWQKLKIHESSPVERGASPRIAKECENYIPSRYVKDVKSGTIVEGNLVEDIEDLSFEDESIDVHVTQDIFEHIYNPYKAFQEIARTLKHGGVHIFTVPLLNKDKPSEAVAIKDAQGHIKYLAEPEYHEDIDHSLVTWHWGADITRRILDACGLYTMRIALDALEFGIRAEYIDVLITRKGNNKE